MRPSVPCGWRLGDAHRPLWAWQPQRLQDRLLRVQACSCPRTRGLHLLQLLALLLLWLLWQWRLLVLLLLLLLLLLTPVFPPTLAPAVSANGVRPGQEPATC